MLEAIFFGCFVTASGGTLKVPYDYCTGPEVSRVKLTLHDGGERFGYVILGYHQKLEGNAVYLPKVRGGECTSITFLDKIGAIDIGMKNIPNEYCNSPALLASTLGRDRVPYVIRDQIHEIPVEKIKQIVAVNSPLNQVNSELINVFHRDEFDALHGRQIFATYEAHSDEGHGVCLQSMDAALSEQELKRIASEPDVSAVLKNLGNEKLFEKIRLILLKRRMLISVCSIND